MHISATKNETRGSKGRFKKNVSARQLREEYDDDFADVEEEMQNSVAVQLADGTTNFVHPDDLEDDDYTGAPACAETAQEEAAPSTQQDEAEASPPEASEPTSQPIGTPISSLKMPDPGPEGLVHLPPTLSVNPQGSVPGVYIGTPQAPASPFDEPELIWVDECAFEIRSGFLHCQRQKKNKVKLSAAFEVSNLVVDEAGIPFAVLVNIPASHGTRGVVLKLIDLTMNDKEAIRALVRNGLWISPHAEAKNLLARFISHSSRDAPRIRGTYRTGLQLFDDTAYFVLPGRTIPDSPASPVLIQEGVLATTHEYRPTKDLKIWRRESVFFAREIRF